MTASEFLLRLRNARRDGQRARAYDRRRGRVALMGALRESGEFIAHLDRLPREGLPVGIVDTPHGEVLLQVAREGLLAHLLLIGATGSGKSTFATSVVGWGLRHGLPVDVIDCKAGFFDAGLREIAAYALTLPPDLREEFIARLLVVDPFGEMVLPLNPCSVPAGSTVEDVAYDVTLALARYFAPMSPLSVHMTNVLRHGLLLLSEAKLSLLELPLILQDEVLRAVLVERSRHPLVKEFFFGVFPTLPSGSAAALAARIQGLFLHESIRLPLGADGFVDLRRVIVEGDPTLVFLGKKAGAPEALVDLFGSLFLQALFQAVFAAEGSGRPRLMLLDEFFHLIEAPSLAARFSTMLASARSFGVSLGFIMHQFAQVPKELREALLGNVGLAGIFRTAQANAAHFADFLPGADPRLVEEALRRGEATPSRAATRGRLMERLQRLPDRAMFWWDRRQPYNAVPVQVLDFVEAHERAGVSREALDEFIRYSGIAHGGYAVSRDVVRRQIAERRERLRALVTPGRATTRPPLRRRATGRPNLG